MIAVQMHLMIVALLPIVGIEVVVLKVRLSLPFWQGVLSSLFANAVSTFVGAP